MGRAGHDPQVREIRGAFLDQQGRGCGVLALHVQVLDDGGGTQGQRDTVDGGDPHGADGALGPAQGHRAGDDQILPVGARRDGEHITVRRRFQSRGEGGVLACAAPPPRCAGVRHLDRALCHGAVVPPPRACVMPVSPASRQRSPGACPAGVTGGPVHRSARGGRELTRTAALQLPVPVLPQSGPASAHARSSRSYRRCTMRHTIRRRPPSISRTDNIVAPKPASAAWV